MEENSMEQVGREEALERIGVTAQCYDSREFQDFEAKFAPHTPVTEVYEIYEKLHAPRDLRPLGSMKNTAPEGGVKEFYSFEEASRFTKRDFDRSPELYRAVQRSMTKW